LRSRPEIPIFLKKRDLLELNKIGTYFDQLKRRVETTNADEQGDEQA
jgi:hypothetical protein